MAFWAIYRVKWWAGIIEISSKRFEPVLPSRATKPLLGYKANLKGSSFSWKNLITKKYISLDLQMKSNKAITSASETQF